MFEAGGLSNGSPRTVVLLIDDQPMVAEAVRRMVAAEPGLDFHFCQDPTQAIDQALAIRPTVILQDLVMPEMDGLTLVRFFRANQATREVPLIVLSTKEEPTVKAQAFALGASDYLVKLPDQVELIARIRHHSQGYIHRLERNAAYQALAESQRMLAQDLAQASEYVQSLLPEPIRPATESANQSLKGVRQVDWCFIPSATLGGDSFGYHWLDDDFAFYLLDVTGHGVKSALLSVSAMNVLRSQSLPNCDFRDPAQVLQGLNEKFPMEKHFDMYFTIWYGIYRPGNHQLVYAGGGHPAALLYSADPTVAVQLLKSQNPIIGAIPDLQIEQTEVVVQPPARLFLFSDGVFEVAQPDGKMWPFADFQRWMDEVARHSNKPLTDLLQQAIQWRGSNNLEDDFSILQVEF